MKSLADLLKIRERQLPFVGSLRANRVCQTFRAWVAATWDSDVVELIRVCSFRDGMLSLGVSSSPFAEELRVREQDLRSHLRAALPKSKVVRVRIFVSG